MLNSRRFEGRLCNVESDFEAYLVGYGETEAKVGFLSSAAARQQIRN